MVIRVCNANAVQRRIHASGRIEITLGSGRLVWPAVPLTHTNTSTSKSFPHLASFNRHTVHGVVVYTEVVSFAYLDNIDGHTYIELQGHDGVKSQTEVCVGWGSVGCPQSILATCRECLLCKQSSTAPSTTIMVNLLSQSYPRFGCRKPLPYLHMVVWAD